MGVVQFSGLNLVRFCGVGVASFIYRSPFSSRLTVIAMNPLQVESNRGQPEYKQPVFTVPESSSGSLWTVAPPSSINPEASGPVPVIRSSALFGPSDRLTQLRLDRRASL